LKARVRYEVTGLRGEERLEVAGRGLALAPGERLGHVRPLGVAPVVVVGELLAPRDERVECREVAHRVPVAVRLERRALGPQCAVAIRDRGEGGGAVALVLGVARGVPTVTRGRGLGRQVGGEQPVEQRDRGAGQELQGARSRRGASAWALVAEAGAAARRRDVSAAAAARAAARCRRRRAHRPTR